MGINEGYHLCICLQGNLAIFPLPLLMQSPTFQLLHSAEKVNTFAYAHVCSPGACATTPLKCLLHHVTTLWQNWRRNDQLRTYAGGRPNKTTCISKKEPLCDPTAHFNMKKKYVDRIEGLLLLPKFFPPPPTASTFEETPLR